MLFVHRRVLVAAVLVLATADFAACKVCHAALPTLQPVSIASLRDFTPTVPADAFVLDFQEVNPSTEDRDIAHYNILSLSQVGQATLTIPLQEQDPGPPLGTFDVYYFYGSGTVSADQWNSGTLLQSFSNVDGDDPVLSVDVTSVLNAGIQQGKSFLSFNFRAGSGTDRYILGSIAVPALPNAFITFNPVPEPASLMLLGLSGCLLLAASKRLWESH